MASGQAPSLLRELSEAVDGFIAGQLGADAKCAVVAVGGYGRAELLPYSDIDVMFLVEDDTQHILIERVLYGLWDAKLQVGHSVRTVGDCLRMAKADLTIRTSLLDARFIGGNRQLYKQFERQVERNIRSHGVAEFVEAKLKERDERHARYGDSRFLLEPHVKEGKGGLRDLQTLKWLVKAAYGAHRLDDLVGRGLMLPEELLAFERTEQFLWKLRAHLHLLAHKAEETVTFSLQATLAARMGYAHPEPHKAVARLMKRYFLAATTVGSLTRIFCAILEMEHKRKPKLPLAQRFYQTWKLDGFVLKGDRLTTLRAEEFEHTPARMMALFSTACKEGMDVHPEALQQITRNLKRVDKTMMEDADVNRQFLGILLHETNTERTLRLMNEVGFLGRFIPSFARIVGQTQFNLYHIYTVDEHTIVALGNLRKLRQGELKKEAPLASAEIAHVSLPHVLALAVLCHDLAKGRSGNEEEIGGRMAYGLAKRFGFSEADASTTAWLVAQHLLLSGTAFKRDLSAPHTIHEFVARVQSVERLRMLLILTVCDMRAVAANVWNAWKASLMRELYQKSLEVMRHGALQNTAQPEQHFRHSLQTHLPNSNIADINAYAEQATPAFITAFSPTQHADLFAAVQQLQDFALLLSSEGHQDITEATIITRDAKGLFSTLAGTLSLAGASIVSAKIFTLKDALAIDSFLIQTAAGKKFDGEARKKRLETLLGRALSGQLQLAEELRKTKASFPTRKDAFKRGVRVAIENSAESLYTLIEVTAPDRTGLLYDLTACLKELQLSIVSAHITTYGNLAVDVFYVKDGFGHRITHEGRLKEIKERLMSAGA